MLYGGYRIIDVVVELRNALRVGRFATGASRVAWAGFSTAVRGLSVTGVILDAVTLPIDLFFAAKGAYDIYKHRTGRGTNSNKAHQLEAMIQKLEEYGDRLSHARDMFGPDPFKETSV